MATELYKEEDSWVYNIGVWKLLLNSLILSCIGMERYPRFRQSHYTRVTGSEELGLHAH